MRFSRELYTTVAIIFFANLTLGAPIVSTGKYSILGHFGTPLHIGVTKPPHGVDKQHHDQPKPLHFDLGLNTGVAGMPKIARAVPPVFTPAIKRDEDFALIARRSFWKDFVSGFKKGFKGTLDIASKILPAAAAIVKREEELATREANWLPAAASVLKREEVLAELAARDV